MNDDNFDPPRNPYRSYRIEDVIVPPSVDEKLRAILEPRALRDAIAASALRALRDGMPAKDLMLHLLPMLLDERMSLLQTTAQALENAAIPSTLSVPKP